MRFLHPLADGYLEGAERFAAAAADAFARMMRKGEIMIPQAVHVALIQLRQIKEFVDGGNVQHGGAGQAVIAVHTASLG